MSLHKPTVFQGAATALITPFAGGKIDYASLERLIEYQIAGGTAAILVAGTTGESATLTLEEHRELTQAAHAMIGGRVPLLVGCGSNATERAVCLAKLACAAGADALLCVTPYYNKASDRGVLAHYRAVCAASDRPVLAYNVPSRTGMSLTLRNYRELAELDGLCGVKEASGDLGLLAELVSESGERLDVYCGNDTQTVAAMRLGACGVISVLSNAFPDRMQALCRLCTDGSDRRAAQLQRELLPLMQALSAEVNPIPIKYALSCMGLCKPEYRLPLCPPAPDTCRRLERLFGNGE